MEYKPEDFVVLRTSEDGRVLDSDNSAKWTGSDVK
jgi:hypothetical protein